MEPDELKRLVDRAEAMWADREREGLFHTQVEKDRMKLIGEVERLQVAVIQASWRLADLIERLRFEEGRATGVRPDAADAHRRAANLLEIATGYEEEGARA